MGKAGISFAIGGSIATVVMVIGMITLVAGTATTATTTSAFGLTGHYTLQVMDPDGNIKAYIQTHNAPTHIFKDCLFEAYFTTMPSITAATCSIATATLQVGDAGDQLAPSDADAGLQFFYTASGAGTALATAGTSSTTSETTVTWDNKASVITISQTDLDDSMFGSAGNAACTNTSGGGGVDCFLDETGLFDADNDLISRATFAQTEVSVGDQVDITLVITLNEP